MEFDCCMLVLILELVAILRFAFDCLLICGWVDCCYLFAVDC